MKRGPEVISPFRSLARSSLCSSEVSLSICFFVVVFLLGAVLLLLDLQGVFSMSVCKLCMCVSMSVSVRDALMIVVNM